MFDLKPLVGLLSLILCILVVFSPLKAVIEGLRKMELKNVSEKYISAAIVNGGLWLIYGLDTGDLAIITTAILFYVVHIFYIGCYYYINENRKMLGLSVSGFILGFIILYFVLPGQVAGFGALLVNTIFRLTILYKTKQALETKSQEYLNLMIINLTFMSNLVWVWYSYLISDIILFIPNITGVICAILNYITLLWIMGKIDDTHLSIISLKKLLSVPLETSQETNRKNTPLV